MALNTSKCSHPTPLRFNGLVTVTTNCIHKQSPNLTKLKLGFRRILRHHVKNDPILLLVGPTVKETRDTHWASVSDDADLSHQSGTCTHHASCQQSSASMFHPETHHQRACISTHHVEDHDLRLTTRCSDVHSPCQTSPGRPDNSCHGNKQHKQQTL